MQFLNVLQNHSLLYCVYFYSQVAFVAGGDTDASRGIAIDDISFLSESCKMQPIDKSKFE